MKIMSMKNVFTFFVAAITAYSVLLSCGSSNPVNEYLSTIDSLMKMEEDNRASSQTDSLQQVFLNTLKSLYEREGSYKLSEKDKAMITDYHIKSYLQDVENTSEEDLGMSKEAYEQLIKSSLERQIKGCKTLGDLLEDLIQTYDLLFSM